MNNTIRDLLLSMAIMGDAKYGQYYSYDEKVNDCLMSMYFYMLYNGMDNDVKREEYFKEFEKSYECLDKEQQDIVKKEYIDIIETQNKKREKEKIKKKGMRDYE